MKHTRAFQSAFSNVWWGVVLVILLFAPCVPAQESAHRISSLHSLNWTGILQYTIFLLTLVYAGYYRYTTHSLRKRLLSYQSLEPHIREHDQWLEATLKSIGDAVITTDNEGKVTFMNRTAEFLTGWSVAEARGKTIGFNSSESDAPPPSHESPTNLIDQEEIVIQLDDEMALISRNGTHIPIEYSGAPIKDQRGNVAGVVMVLKDITERKLAEERLQQAYGELEIRVRERTAELAKASDELRILGQAVETMKLGVTIADISGTILYANPADAWMHGYTIDELIGQNVQLYAPPELRQPMTLEQIENMQGWVRESFNIRKNQSVFPVHLTSSVVRDDAEKPLAIVTTCEDITQRTKTEKELANERNLLRTLVDSIPDYIYIKDVHHQFMLVNKASTSPHFQTVNDFVGKTDFDLFPQEVAQHLLLEEQQILTSGHPLINHEEVTPDPETGDHRWFSTTKVPLRNSQGEITGLIGISRNISEKKRTEAKIEHINIVLRAIQDVNQIIVREKNRNLLIHNTCQRLIETRGFEASAIFLMEPNETVVAAVEPELKEQLTAMLVNLRKEEIPPPCVQQVLKQPEALVVRELSNHSKDALVSTILPKSQKMLVRLAHNERCYGVLVTFFPETVEVYDEDKTLLEDVAGDIAFALHSIDVEEERRQAEKTLRENERFLNSVFDAIQDGITVLSPDLSIIRTNRWMEQRHRASTPLVGKKCYNAFHRRDDACHNCPALATLNTGKPYHEIMPCTTADGDTCWLDVSSFPLVDDENQVVGVIEYVKDISEQKKAEKTVEHERQRLFELLENLPVYVYLQAPDYSIRFANRNFRERFGEPERGYCYKLLWGRGELWEDSPTYHVFYSQKPQEWEWNHYPSGKIYHVFDYPFTDFDGSPLVLELGIDITDRKQMELALQEERTLLAKKVEERTAELSTINQQLQQEIEEREQIQIELQHSKEAAIEAQQAAESASQAKSEFLANMSHELRTPLNAVLGYAQILKQADNLTERQIENLTTIYNSGQHLLNLINEILDLSKIEAGQMEIDYREFHLPDFLRRITDMIRVRAEEKGLVFAYEAKSELPEGIKADEKKLRQVLINLLGNAIKFTEQGTVTLRVKKLETRNLEQETPDSPSTSKSSLFPVSRIQFQIEDTGIGIDKERLDDIFLPFQQVGESRYTSEGTGLGLAISRKLVNMLGSELCVKSTPGKGSCFWFELEVFEVAGVSPPETPTHEHRIIGYKGAQKTILVTDDNRENRGVVVNMLLPLGFKVFEAENGHECIEKAYTARPDAILLDLRMPLMDGFETARHLRKQPQLQTISIIAISASVYEEIRQRSLEAGCNAFLTKPLHFEDLLGALQKILQLEWIHSEELVTEEEQSPIVIPVSDDIIFPETDIKSIQTLAEKGRAKKLLLYLDTLEQQQEYQPIIEELRDYVKRFQFKLVLERMQAMKEAL